MACGVRGCGVGLHRTSEHYDGWPKDAILGALSAMEHTAVNLADALLRAIRRCDCASVCSDCEKDLDLYARFTGQETKLVIGDEWKRKAYARR